MIFIGVVIFAPFTLGRVILHHVASADLLKGFVAGGPSKLYDVTTLTVGYMFVVFLYLGTIALIRYFKGPPLNFDRLYGVAASVVETMPPMIRKLSAGIKPGTLVAYYFGVLPLMCGWCLDVFTVSVFGETTMSSRVEYLSVSPLASPLVHWAVGALYLSKIGICEELLPKVGTVGGGGLSFLIKKCFFSVLIIFNICFFPTFFFVQVLRREALFFLDDPHEDDDDPFQFIIEEAERKLGWGILLDVAKYGSLIFLLVFLPVKLAIMMAPTVFPLDIS